MAGLTLGVVAARRLLMAVHSGAVECFAGPVRVGMRGRAGWWLTVQDRSFHIPVQFWHVGRDVSYRVYVAPAAKLIVAMEPDVSRRGRGTEVTLRRQRVRGWGQGADQARQSGRGNKGT